VEGVHFDLSYTSAFDLGTKALAVNLSDLAAMGARPEYVLVSLGLKQEATEYFVEEIYRGIKQLAKKFSVDVVGGNLVQSPLCTTIDITAIGSVGKRYFTRRDAKVGDWLVVTGQLGSSAAGLQCLRKLSRQEITDSRLQDCVDAHLRPMPRVRESLFLQKFKGIGAMIDVSDGLAKEIHHLASSSKVGFLIEESLIPTSPSIQKAGELLGKNSSGWPLYGGEDYELLFTVNEKQWSKLSAEARRLKIKLTAIGRATSAKKGVQIQKKDGTVQRLEPLGWNHFVKRSSTGTAVNLS
jgi:thiamine-monophosphate kinase